MTVRKLLPLLAALLAGCGPELAAEIEGAAATTEDLAALREQAFPGRTGNPGTGSIHGPSGWTRVEFVEIDGHAVIGGDVAIPLEEVMDELPREKGAGRTSSALWPSGEVPYAIDPNLPSPSRVTGAIAEWHTETNLRFVPRTTESSYVYFTTGSGCSSSSVGKTTGTTVIALESGCSTGNVVHEIGHAIGLHHEQCRTDRDSYITINWSNIDSSWTYQYQTYTAQGYSGSRNLREYDYDSIMHYPAYCPTDTSKTCIVVPDGQHIGQRNGLSDGDIRSVQLLYDGVLDVSAAIDGSWGGWNQGAGVAFAAIDADPRPDAVFVRMDDPPGGNEGYYRVAFNVGAAALLNGGGTTYRPTSYGPSTPIAFGAALGDETSGAGGAIGDIDGNGRPDLLFLWIDNPSGPDATYYQIGWNLDASGVVSSWSPRFSFLGGFHGYDTAGADVALRDLNGNGKLDLVVATVDNPSDNRIYVSVGWDLNTGGVVAGGWSPALAKPGWVGADTAELGLDVADMDGNGKLDLVVSWVDAVGGDDAHYVQIGYDVSAPMTVAGWSPIRQLSSRLGDTTHGVDIAIQDLDGNGSLDLMTFYLDPAGHANIGYTAVSMDRSEAVYRLVAKHSGKYLDVAGVSTADGARIQQWSSTAGNNQKFTFAKTDDGYVNLIAKHSGKCVGVAGAGTQPGTAIVQWACNGADDQKWTAADAGNGDIQLRPKHAPGMCLDISGAALDNGAAAILWTCHTNDNQKLRPERVSG